MARSKFYLTPEWQRARRQSLHDAGYVCARCGTSQVGKGKGAIVHHKKPLAVAVALRSGRLNLEPQCVECHNRTHAQMKRGASGACDVNGMPLDARHPWYAASTARKDQ